MSHVLFFLWVSCLVPWRRRQKVTSKQFCQSNKLHGITSQNTVTLPFFLLFYSILWTERGHAVAQLVEALCYMPEGRGFESRWGELFNLPNPSSRTMALGWTRPPTEMSTRNLPGGKGRPAPSVSRLSRKCGNLNLSKPYGPPRPVIGIALHYLWTERVSVVELKNYASIFICGILLCPEVRCNQIQPIYKFVKSVYFAFSRGEPTCSTRDRDLRFPGSDKKSVERFRNTWSLQLPREI
jgi:hypothetical protein